MKKFKGFFAGVRVVATCFIIALAIAMVGCDKQPLHDPSHDSSSTSFDLQASEVISILEEAGVIKSRELVDETYQLNSATINRIAEFVLEYPVGTNEQISISADSNKTSVVVFASNRPNYDITDKVDEETLELTRKLFEEEKCFLINGNLGNDYVIFAVANIGIGGFNGVIISKENITPQEVESSGIQSSIMQKLYLLEPIEESVYYFEAQ